MSPLYENCSLLLDSKKITTGLIDEYRNDLQHVDDENNIIMKTIKKLASYLKPYLFIDNKDNFDFTGTRPDSDLVKNGFIEGSHLKLTHSGQVSGLYDTFDYTLFKIKNTTPAELFNKKLAGHEWGEALEVAERFDGLDKDLVYQRRWELCDKNEVSYILDFLDKVENLSWVLKQCLVTVPESWFWVCVIFIYTEVKVILLLKTLSLSSSN